MKKTLINTELAEGAYLPEASPESVGYDLRTPEPFSLYSGESRFVDTGVTVELAANQWAMIAGRSGLAKKHHIGLTNGIGVVDPGYRGTIGVILINNGPDKHTFSRGDRIAQLVLMPAVYGWFEEASTINKTTVRGTGGFGSTGR